tara:strand:+ start:4832 stop:6703 length:1872 start_codon:yes stop_codon:yes gene_type:complete
MNMPRLLTASLIGFVIAIGASSVTGAAEISAGGIQIFHQSPTTQVGQSFKVDLQLPGVVTVGDQITVTIHEPVKNEAQFLESTVAENLGGVLTSLQFDLAKLKPDAWGRATIELPITESGTNGVRIARPGVYPVSIEMRTARQELIGKVLTHLIRTGDGPSQKLRLALVGDLHTSLSPSNSRPALISEWLDVFNSHLSIPVSITLHPTSINENLPIDAPTKLGSKNHEIIRNPFVPINEASLVDAGLRDEVSSLLDMGSQQLTTFGKLAPTTFWVGHERADDTQLDVRWDRGIREVVVNAVSLSPIPEKNPRGPVELLTGSSTLRGLVVDDLAPQQPHDTPSSAAQRALSHLAVIALTDQSNPLLTVAVGSSERGPEFTDLFLTGIENLEWVDPLRASAAINTSFLVEDGQPQQFRIRARLSSTTQNFTEYREAVRHLEALRSMVRDEDATTYDLLSDKLLLSLSSDVSQLQRRDLWGSTVDLVRLETSLVDIPPDESIQLTSQKASVPFSFQNRAGVPLRVELRIISERLTVEDFDDGESTTLVLDPGVTTHRFRLRALGSGSFPISIELHSPNGGLMIGKAQAALRATTPTGVGLGLTVGAAVFLAFWWLLDTRRRKARQA